MYISSSAAQAIVEEIGHEIKEHINLMDPNGRIIASTNPSRIGVVHDGARRIIEENLDTLYISKDMETETTKQGINLPLIVNKEIFGVVGITGNKERVEGYGNIVRRMTEIMVSDTLQKDVKRYDRRVRYRFLEEMITKSNNIFDDHFKQRGLRLGIDLEQPRRVLIVKFVNYQALGITLDGQQLMEKMENSICHKIEKLSDNLYLREPSKQICLIQDCPDKEMKSIAEDLSNIIDKKYQQKIVIGIDSSSGNKLNISRSCEEAEKAAANALTWGSRIIFYDDISLELFFNEIKESTMSEYLKKFFNDNSEGKLDDYMNIIEAYFIYNGSIKKIAEALFMHKNTLQYQLKKMADQTGKDIRLPSGSVFYYIALMFYRNLYHRVFYSTNENS